MKILIALASALLLTACHYGDATDHVEHQLPSQPYIHDCVDTNGDGWGWNGVETCDIDSEHDVEPSSVSRLVVLSESEFAGLWQCEGAPSRELALADDMTVTTDRGVVGHWFDAGDGIGITVRQNTYLLYNLTDHEKTTLVRRCVVF